MAHPNQPDAESLRLELQEAITTFRHQIALILQLLGVIVTADSVLVAYGFTQKQSGILLIASLMPIAALLVFGSITHGLVPISYTAMRLEERLSLHHAPLITTWVKNRDDLPFAVLGNVDDWSDPKVEEVISSTSRWFFLRSYKSHILLIIFVLQILLFIITIVFSHYRFM